MAVAVMRCTARFRAARCRCPSPTRRTMIVLNFQRGNDMKVYKLFVENDSFKRFVSNMVFELTQAG